MQFLQKHAIEPTGPFSSLNSNLVFEINIRFQNRRQKLKHQDFKRKQAEFERTKKNALLILNSAFELNPDPSEEELNQYAVKVKVSPQCLRIWFENKRKKLLEAPKDLKESHATKLPLIQPKLQPEISKRPGSQPQYPIEFPGNDQLHSKVGIKGNRWDDILKNIQPDFSLFDADCRPDLVRPVPEGTGLMQPPSPDLPTFPLDDAPITNSQSLLGGSNSRPTVNSFALNSPEPFGAKSTIDTLFANPWPTNSQYFNMQTEGNIGLPRFDQPLSFEIPANVPNLLNSYLAEPPILGFQPYTQWNHYLSSI